MTDYFNIKFMYSTQPLSLSPHSHFSKLCLNRLLKQMKRWSTSKLQHCLENASRSNMPHTTFKNTERYSNPSGADLATEIILLLLGSAGPLKLLIRLFIYCKNNKHIPSSHIAFLVLLFFVGFYLSSCYLSLLFVFWSFSQMHIL